MSSPSKDKQDQVDPLYVIFEQHLYNFQDSDADRRTFIHNIVHEYLRFLRKMNIAIPKSLEESIVEELSAQVNTMLVKKIYGFMTIEDYRKKVPTTAKRKSRTKYSRMVKKTPKVKASAP